MTLGGPLSNRCRFNFSPAWSAVYSTVHAMDVPFLLFAVKGSEVIVIQQQRECEM